MRSGILRDIALFLAVLLFLMIVVPIISSIFKQLILLQLAIFLFGTVALAYIVHRARKK